jgi:hypothetical protein
MTTYRILRLNLRIRGFDPSVVHDALRLVPSRMAAELGPRRAGGSDAGSSDAGAAQLAAQIARHVARQVRDRATGQG